MYLLTKSENIHPASENWSELWVAGKAGIALPFGKLISPRRKLWSLIKGLWIVTHFARVAKASNLFWYFWSYLGNVLYWERQIKKIDKKEEEMLDVHLRSLELFKYEHGTSEWSSHSDHNFAAKERSLLLVFWGSFFSFVPLVRSLLLYYYGCTLVLNFSFFLFFFFSFLFF